MTREEAREYFKKCHLNYEDINMNDIYKLIQILNKKISEVDSVLLMINEPKIKGSYKDIVFKKDKLNFAQIRVKGDYFASREAITFNQDGFIGFCGWASDDNAKPIIDGFIEWCNYIKNKKLGDANE
ncbi:MAG: hypothetical protein OSJ70_04880 [Bacilli bacterium]|nr:hypothetical protein [Bacilli bacterium]